MNRFLCRCPAPVLAPENIKQKLPWYQYSRRKSVPKPNLSDIINLHDVKYLNHCSAQRKMLSIQHSGYGIVLWHMMLQVLFHLYIPMEVQSDQNQTGLWVNSTPLHYFRVLKSISCISAVQIFMRHLHNLSVIHNKLSKQKRQLKAFHIHV